MCIRDRAYLQMFRVFRLIDKRFDAVCRDYRKNYDKLTSMEFWKQYLELEVRAVSYTHLAGDGPEYCKAYD